MSGKYAFTKTLKELRFLHCQTSEHSNAVRYDGASLCKAKRQKMADERYNVRSFLTRAYPTMKKNNPYTPIMIREASGTEPRVYARYEFGREKMEDLKGMRHVNASVLHTMC